MQPGHAQALGAGHAAAEDDVSFDQIVRSLPDIEASARADHGVAGQFVVVGFERNDLGPLAIRSLEEIAFDHAPGAVLGLGVEFSRSPHAQNLASVTVVVRDVLEITTADDVAPAVGHRVAEQGLHVVLALEVAALDEVVVTFEEDPVILVLELLRIEIHDGRVFHRRVVREKVNDRGVLGREGSAGEIEAVRHNVRRFDPERGRAGQDGFAGNFRADDEGLFRSATFGDLQGCVFPVALGQDKRVAGFRRFERARKGRGAGNRDIAGIQLEGSADKDEGEGGDGFR